MKRKFKTKFAARRRKTEDIQILNDWMFGIIGKLNERIRKARKYKATFFS